MKFVEKEGCALGIQGWNLSGHYVLCTGVKLSKKKYGIKKREQSSSEQRNNRMNKTSTQSKRVFSFFRLYLRMRKPIKLPLTLEITVNVPLVLNNYILFIYFFTRSQWFFSFIWKTKTWWTWIVSLQIITVYYESILKDIWF